MVLLLGVRKIRTFNSFSNKNILYQFPERGKNTSFANFGLCFCSCEMWNILEHHQNKYFVINCKCAVCAVGFFMCGEKKQNKFIQIATNFLMREIVFNLVANVALTTPSLAILLLKMYRKESLFRFMALKRYPLFIKSFWLKSRVAILHFWSFSVSPGFVLSNLIIM